MQLLKRLHRERKCLEQQLRQEDLRDDVDDRRGGLKELGEISNVDHCGRGGRAAATAAPVGAALVAAAAPDHHAVEPGGAAVGAAQEGRHAAAEGDLGPVRRRPAGGAAALPGDAAEEAGTGFDAHKSVQSVSKS